jgi:hypothetical protein
MIINFILWVLVKFRMLNEGTITNYNGHVTKIYYPKGSKL